jgi:hypothetical protein
MWCLCCRCGPEKGSTNGSTFMPLYSELRCTYVVVSKGYQCVSGVLERVLTHLGVTIDWINTHVTHWYYTVFIETCLEGSLVEINSLSHPLR